MKENEWVDFKAVKAAVTMQMVLDHYGVKGLKRVGDEMTGRCPIHNDSSKSKHFSANLEKNAFKCFSGSCGKKGNVLDFVAAMESCSVRDAALKLAGWFKVGDSDASKNESENSVSLTASAIESLNNLIAELEVHGSRIAYHASQLEAKTAAVKHIVTTLQKGD